MPTIAIAREIDKLPVVSGARRAQRRWFGAKRERVTVSDETGRALIARWRRGDETAFDDIFKEYRQLVYGVLHKLLPNDPDLEDVVQTAFLEVFRSLNSFEGRSKLSSWIARIALHVGYHHIRHRKSRPATYRAEALVVDPPDQRAATAPDTSVERGEIIERVHEILSQLSPKKRTVFILNDLQGVPQDEIAEIVGVSIATVRTRLFYARRDFWKKAGDDLVLASIVQPGRGEV